MTDPVPEFRPDYEKVARQRFFAIGIIRLAGVFVLMFGFLILMQRFSWVQGDKAKIMGVIVSTVGVIQTIVIPRLLLRAFRGPKPPQTP
jgi:hypothetical protein